MVKCSKKEYCEAQGGNVFECSDSEGCKLDNGTCKLNEDKIFPIHSLMVDLVMVKYVCQK